MNTVITFQKPCNENEIQELIYSHSLPLIPLLEDYIHEQYTSGDNNVYDYYSHKILLKLYQCYPNLLDVDIITEIFILSLMKLPSNNYLALTYLIPVKILSTNNKLKYLTLIANLLESGKFIQFWTEYRNNEGIITNSQAFENSIRQYIVNSVSLVFHDIQTNLLASFLGFNENEMKSYLAAFPNVFEVNFTLIAV